MLRLSPPRPDLLVSSIDQDSGFQTPHLPYLGFWTISDLRNLVLVTPTTCKALIDAGYQVTVERSTQRIFDGAIFSPFLLPGR